MTETFLANTLFHPSHLMRALAPRHSAAASRPGQRKEFRSNRKKIVDSAPLCVYVQVNLPNCKQTDTARHTMALLPGFSLRRTRSAFMALMDKERRLKAKRLYEEGHLKSADIAAQCGVTAPTITRWAKMDRWTRKPPQAEAVTEPVDRRALVARAWRNAERQLRAVEKRLRVHGGEDAPLDESARLIATLVKTLRELAALDRALAEDEIAHGKKTGKPGSGDIPRDLNAFYEELAARMDRLRQHRDRDANFERSAAGADG